MIQRIQTIYLLIAVILMAIMLFAPFADIFSSQGNELFVFHSNGLFVGDSNKMVIPTWPISILIAGILVLLITAIGLFKKRRLQARICIYTILLLVGLAGLIFYYLSVVFKGAELADYSFRLPVIFPIVSIILIYLAFRGIRKDEALIRSIDKIR